MSYSTPASKSTGDTVSAANWNVIVDDITACSVALVTTKGDLTAATGANALARLATATDGSQLITAASQTTGLKWQTPQNVRAVRTANQSISNSTDTAIQFNDTDDLDTNTLHDTVTNNTRITIAAAGVYLVGGRVKWAASTGGTLRQAWIRRGGSTELAKVTHPAAAGAGVLHEFEVIELRSFSAGDYIELMVQQDSGGALNVTKASFWAHLVTATQL